MKTKTTVADFIWAAVAVGIIAYGYFRYGGIAVEQYDRRAGMNAYIACVWEGKPTFYKHTDKFEPIYVSSDRGKCRLATGYKGSHKEAADRLWEMSK